MTIWHWMALAFIVLVIWVIATLLPRRPATQRRALPPTQASTAGALQSTTDTAVSASATPPANDRPYFTGDPIRPVQVPADWAEQHSPIEVRSETNRERTYVVNLAKRTCTCPDFVKARATYPDDDIRRFCKHARSLIQKHESDRQLPPALRAILADPDSRRQQHFHQDVIGDIPVVYGFDVANEWINVYAPDRPKSENAGQVSTIYARFGYNLRERRWAYGENLRWVSGVAKRLNALFDRDILIKRAPTRRR